MEETTTVGNTATATCLRTMFGMFKMECGAADSMNIVLTGLTIVAVIIFILVVYNRRKESHMKKTGMDIDSQILG